MSNHMKKILTLWVMVTMTSVTFLLIMTKTVKADGPVYHTLIVSFDPGYNRVMEVDESGLEVWTKTGLSYPASAERLANGNTLIAELGDPAIATDGRVTEVDSSGAVVWTYRPSYIYYSANDAERLANGNTLIADGVSNGGNWIHRVVEVNSAKVIVWQLTESQIVGGLRGHNDVERLANGNTLIADSYNNNYSPQGRVIEVNSSGTIVWEKTGLDRPLSAQRLTNGNTLISDYYNDRVIEVNAAGGIAWQYNTYHPNDAKRLVNGNTLMSTYTRVKEIDSSSTTVWEIAPSLPRRVERIIYPDNDGDGYASNVDCDDDDPDRFPGKLEECDGIDNDCDDMTVDGTDEIWLEEDCDGPDTDLCMEGTYICSAGNQICTDTTGSTNELCDGVDNDCNPSTADGASELWIGALCDGPDTDFCMEGTYICSAGNQICTDTTGSTNELCDGIDNDCDGEVDEGFNPGEPCSVGIGACERSGVTICSSGGTYTICDAIPGTPTEEVCDGIDNNCDGEVDEGVQTVYYRDSDGDSWGNGLDPCGLACTAPPGCVANKEDCDDSTGTIGSCNTPPSEDPVHVTYKDENGGVDLEFPDVTVGGETTIVPITGCTLGLPAGYTLNLSEFCYDIQSDAQSSEKLEVCITYKLSDILTPPGTNGVVILKCDNSGGNCVPLIHITSDVDNDAGTGTICALSDGLSIFSIVTEPDSDYDGWRDSRDNCPEIFNPQQDDNDSDGFGNACDNCIDAWDPSNLCSMCEGDFYADGDVDGADIKYFASNPSFLSLSSFATNFGRSNCPILNAECSGPISYDTGIPAWHWAVNPGYGIAVKFTPPNYPWIFDTARFWPWSSSDGLGMELHVWDDDGEGGTPGTDLIMPVSHHLTTTDQWADIPLPQVTISEGSFFIGWIQTLPQLFYNAEDNGTSYNGRSFALYPDGSWKNFSDIKEDANIMIRQGCKN